MNMSQTLLSAGFSVDDILNNDFIKELSVPSNFVEMIDLGRAKDLSKYVDGFLNDKDVRAHLLRLGEYGILLEGGYFKEVVAHVGGLKALIRQHYSDCVLLREVVVVASDYHNGDYDSVLIEMIPELHKKDVVFSEMIINSTSCLADAVEVFLNMGLTASQLKISPYVEGKILGLSLGGILVGNNGYGDCYSGLDKIIEAGQELSARNHIVNKARSIDGVIQSLGQLNVARASRELIMFKRLFKKQKYYGKYKSDIMGIMQGVVDELASSNNLRTLDKMRLCVAIRI